LLDGKPRFIRSLGTDNLTEANRLKLPLVAEWKRQINIRNAASLARVAGPEPDFQP
jgi:hypothetical protein